MSRWIDVGVVALSGALVLAAGCKKKEADTGKAAGSATPVVSASASASAAATKVPSYTHGEALRHMPKDCEHGRLYVDAAAFAALAGDAVQGLGDQWAALVGEDGQAVNKAVAALRKGGFDPATALKELAVCIGKKEDDVVFAVGMGLSQVEGDPLELVIAAAKAVSKDVKAEKKREGKLAYLVTKQKGDDAAMAIVGSSLIVGKDLPALKRAQQESQEF